MNKFSNSNVLAISLLFLLLTTTGAAPQSAYSGLYGSQYGSGSLYGSGLSSNQYGSIGGSPSPRTLGFLGGGGGVGGGGSLISGLTSLLGLFGGSGRQTSQQAPGGFSGYGAYPVGGYGVYPLGGGVGFPYGGYGGLPYGGLGGYPYSGYGAYPIYG